MQKSNNVRDAVHLSFRRQASLFPSDSFDAVFGYEVLYYLNGELCFGDEIVRLLKLGGKAVFVTQ